jgi:putative membrane protein
MLPALFGAGFLMADTAGGSYHKADITALLSGKRLREIAAELFDTARISFSYKAGIVSTAALAATWSNSASGLLIMIPFVDRIGVLLGEGISEEIYGTLKNPVPLEGLLPGAASGMIWLLAAGWAFAFLIQFSSIGGFSASISEGVIRTECGILGRRRKFVRLSAISAVTVRQTLFMRIFGLSSAYFHSIGCNTEKGERSMLVACVSKQRIRDITQKVLPKLSDDRESETFRIDKRALGAFISFPVIEGVGAALGAFLISLLLPGFSALVLWLFLMYGIFFIWRLTIRIIAYKESRVELSSGGISLWGCRKLYLYQTLIPNEKIELWQIKQNFLQKKSGMCTISFYVMSEKKNSFSIFGLNLEQAHELVKKGIKKNDQDGES